ncbi:Putative peptidase S10, serine carboxypeptidase, serine carboxypeptidase, serine active [Septoria linicola]|uniref:Carboxypeptidase n=1 Tax=Septoria linicola TaxID=215465 RepID=A0A9Q9AXQ5_9PEZI|nr:putative peptidase S10, serine carboxypeptidase, serine carboxypeptidase, serine active [Septoria linicola]USW53847.1 Putative peptidase S10, serine carboxypeptidase, serine carboxypeptidase, serine active [Septoria linicola]
MKVTSSLAALGLLASVSSAMRDPTKFNKKNVPPQLAKRVPQSSSPPGYGSAFANSSTPIINQTEAVKKFAVNGSAIPDVDFDVGESYAGMLPIGPGQNVSELWFWFFPSSNPDAISEITIWLNGGPGCSSLEGLLQENGPFLWQYGTFKPVKNPYTWVNLTNVVWIEQPAGTGFSPQKGTPPATDEIEVAKQFLGFWKNFVDTFGLHDRKIFITGESYAGYYVPYIADAMHNETDTEYYNVESIMFYDPSLTDDVVQGDIPALPFVDYWGNLFNLNDTYMEELHERHEQCGYQKFIDEAYKFPPSGPLPTPPDVDMKNDSCRIFNDITTAASLVNPCWDIYQVATTCPLLWDVLGFPGSFGYTPEGANIYFNRTDVQKAINAPLGEWEECSGGVLDTDNSPPSALSVLPRVIEKNKKTIIAHAELDFVLIKNGSIFAIQNMTWSGAQGFSKSPEEWNDFYVPYHTELSQGTLAGAGNFGKWHTERGLTFATVELSGHMVPQYAPSAAYRQLEFLLGRISDLGEISDFTTQSGDLGNGNATMKLF